MFIKSHLGRDQLITELYQTFKMNILQQIEALKVIIACSEEMDLVIMKIKVNRNPLFNSKSQDQKDQGVMPRKRNYCSILC
jgi:hypothetical protein